MLPQGPSASLEPQHGVIPLHFAINIHLNNWKEWYIGLVGGGFKAECSCRRHSLPCGRHIIPDDGLAYSLGSVEAQEETSCGPSEYWPRLPRRLQALWVLASSAWLSRFCPGRAQKIRLRLLGRLSRGPRQPQRRRQYLWRKFPQRPLPLHPPPLWPPSPRLRRPCRHPRPPRRYRPQHLQPPNLHRPHLSQ